MFELGVDVNLESMSTWSRCCNLESMLKLGVDVETWSRCLNLESMFEFGVDVKLCLTGVPSHAKIINFAPYNTNFILETLYLLSA